MSSCMLLVVGNEILDGSVTDTNSSWVCRQMTGRGASVSRILTVEDSKSEISSALAFMTAASPSLIVTLGGLGPTRDDLTVESVSDYLGVDVVEHPDGLAIVRRRYQELATEGRLSDTTSAAAQEARDKMAKMPRAAVALDNHVGAAPGVWISGEPTSVLCLPGVPSELKYIFSEEAGPFLERVLGVGYYKSATLTVEGNDESELSPVLSQFDRRFGANTVYLKSRARHFGSDVRMEVTVSAKGPEKGEVSERLNAAVKLFTALLAESDIGVEGVVFDA